MPTRLEREAEKRASIYLYVGAFARCVVAESYVACARLCAGNVRKNLCM